jgi:hypothetical protein
MNCWNTLRAESNHNVTGNGERDGLKMLRIGQSAAKALCYVHSVSNVQRLSRKGVRASARKDATEHSTKNGSDEIVFSAWKHAAASFPKSSGARLSESRAKNKAYIGDDYYALAWPTTLRTFKNNLETIHQYSDTGFKLIMNGEIGRYENVRYIEQTNIAKGLGTDGVTVTPFVNGKSDWIFIFGNDTVAEAIAVPEEMRGKIPTDYGRSKGVAWYYLGQGITGPVAVEAANDNFVNSGDIPRAA